MTTGARVALSTPYEGGMKRGTAGAARLEIANGSSGAAMGEEPGTRLVFVTFDDLPDTIVGVPQHWLTFLPG